jgi:hypothetical protein
MNKPKIQIIFEERENAEVRQDKRPPWRSTESSNQPYTAKPSAEDRQKHHGSENRQTAAISARTPFDIKRRITAMAQAQGLSESAVVMALVKKALQVEADLRYGALLEPVIRQQIHKDLQAYSNRIASLAVHARDSAEEARLLLIKVLSLLLNTDRQVLNHLIEEAKREARANMARGN